jgi:hypothetical protein
MKPSRRGIRRSRLPDAQDGKTEAEPAEELSRK